MLTLAWANQGLAQETLIKGLIFSSYFVLPYVQRQASFTFLLEEFQASQRVKLLQVA